MSIRDDSIWRLACGHTIPALPSDSQYRRIIKGRDVTSTTAPSDPWPLRPRMCPICQRPRRIIGA